MKTYEVRFREEDGTVTASYYRFESAEALFDYLADMSDSLDIVGYNVVGG